MTENTPILKYITLLILMFTNLTFCLSQGKVMSKNDVAALSDTEFAEYIEENIENITLLQENYPRIEETYFKLYQKKPYNYELLISYTFAMIECNGSFLESNAYSKWLCYKILSVLPDDEKFQVQKDYFLLIAAKTIDTHIDKVEENLYKLCFQLIEKYKNHKNKEEAIIYLDALETVSETPAEINNDIAENSVAFEEVLSKLELAHLKNKVLNQYDDFTLGAKADAYLDIAYLFIVNGVGDSAVFYMRKCIQLYEKDMSTKQISRNNAYNFMANSQYFAGRIDSLLYYQNMALWSNTDKPLPKDSLANPDIEDLIRNPNSQASWQLYYKGLFYISMGEAYKNLDYIKQGIKCWNQLLPATEYDLASTFIVAPQFYDKFIDSYSQTKSYIIIEGVKNYDSIKTNERYLDNVFQSYLTMYSFKHRWREFLRRNKGTQYNNFDSLKYYENQITKYITLNPNWSFDDNELFKIGKEGFAHIPNQKQNTHINPEAYSFMQLKPENNWQNNFTEFQPFYGLYMVHLGDSIICCRLKVGATIEAEYEKVHEDYYKKHKNIVNQTLYKGEHDANVYAKSASIIKNILFGNIQFKKDAKVKMIIGSYARSISLEALVSEYDSTKEYTFSNLPYLIHDFSIEEYSFNEHYFKTSPINKTKYKHEYLAIKPSFFESATATNREGFYALEGASNEVDFVSANFPENAVIVDNITTEKLLNDLPSTKILHLATHGVSDTKNGEFSKVIIGKQDTSYHYLLGIDIEHLNMNTDLVIASSCNSGYGEYLYLDYMKSLSQSFLIAGAKSVLSSRWEVDDVQGQKIVSQFMENYLKKTPVAEALRNAKLDFLSKADPFTSHPKYWANFSLAGQQNAVYQEPENEDWLWFVAATFAMVFALALFLFKK